MMNMQALIDGMSAQWQRERANTQMTLGGMIEFLEAMPDDMEIKGLGDLESYRGYYSDLAFNPADTIETSKELLKRCKEAMGQVFTGYKGGDFVMGALTPLWIAEYGHSGVKIIAISQDGEIETKEDDE